jgi:aminoglycoside phosphotransferase (APT) family kinase protein
MVRYYHSLKKEANSSSTLKDHQLLTRDFFLTHFDLNDNNVYVADGDEVKITGIAGWERSHSSPKWEDHANVIFALDTPNEAEQGEVIEALRQYGLFQPTGMDVLQTLCPYTTQ